MTKFFIFDLSPQKKTIAKIKEDENFHNTYDYKKVEELLFKRYKESRNVGKVFTLTPSMLTDNLGHEYFDIRVCHKMYDDYSPIGWVGIDTTAVIRVNVMGEITFHKREDIENKEYDKFLTHIPVDKYLKAPLEKSDEWELNTRGSDISCSFK